MEPDEDRSILRRRRAGPAGRRQAAALSDHAAARGLVPHPRGDRRPRRPDRHAGGVYRPRQHRPAVPGGAAHPLGRRPEDAPRRPGHLSEGPRGHPDRGRHRPGDPGPRGRRGIRRALDGAAAGRAPRWSATSCGRTSPTGPGPTWRPCSGTGARYRVELRDVYEGIEEVGARPDPARPARAVEGAAARRQGPASRRDPLRLPALDQSDGPAAGGHGAERVRDGLDPGGAPPHLAHRGPLGAAGPPDGRAHRVPHHRPAPVPFDEEPAALRSATARRWRREVRPVSSAR